MQKNSLITIKDICLEDFAETYRQVEQEICQLYDMYGNSSSHINKRNVSIAFCDSQQSDNYIYEFIMNDDIVATVYVRRNDANIIDLLISLY